jgi:hypothetical protein
VPLPLELVIRLARELLAPEAGRLPLFHHRPVAEVVLRLLLAQGAIIRLGQQYAWIQRSIRSQIHPAALLRAHASSGM